MASPIARPAQGRRSISGAANSGPREIADLRTLRSRTTLRSRASCRSSALSWCSGRSRFLFVKFSPGFLKARLHRLPGGFGALAHFHPRGLAGLAGFVQALDSLVSLFFQSHDLPFVCRSEERRVGKE